MRLRRQGYGLSEQQHIEEAEVVVEEVVTVAIELEEEDAGLLLLQLLNLRVTILKKKFLIQILLKHK